MTTTKKYIFVLLSFLFISTQSLFAQQDEKAKKILDEMSNFYQGLNAFSADVHQEAISTSEGKLGDIDMKAIISGNKYQLQLDGQTIYSDTKDVYRYDQEMEEVTIESAEGDDESLTGSPSQIYTLYQKNFKYLHAGKENGLDIIDLSPDKSLDINYFRIRMYIKSSTKELVKWEMYEKGNLMKYVYVINNFDKNVTVSDSDFKFNVASHPDVEVVDLR
ncbi:outer membrane lipoprotein carrier protein LolA [Flammeovirga sp. OC4]|uniref:LolA family protein n=1 Tax=Flammeovirga sp. OC4 TaxID=1382345 RepID=UPI0005C71801|nr:outer membrane lipoprotein carrier protein LolA [Flammeovirga sp. OC4]